MFSCVPRTMSRGSPCGTAPPDGARRRAANDLTATAGKVPALVVTAAPDGEQERPPSVVQPVCEAPMTAMNEPDDWRSRGACVSADPDLFFPVSSAGAGQRQEEKARAFCGRCQVRPQCLAFALATRQAHGVWGGTTEDERRRLRQAEHQPEQRSSRRPGTLSGGRPPPQPDPPCPVPDHPQRTCCGSAGPLARVRQRVAALIRARCDRPWGRLPRNSPLAGSICSESSPTSLRHRTASSITSRARWPWPVQARASTSQNVQATKRSPRGPSPCSGTRRIRGPARR